MSPWPFDFHCHTKWSDGADSLAAMLQSARAQGLAVLGVSDHSPMPWPDAWSMTWENAPLRLAELQTAQAEGAEPPRLLCGLELDLMSRDFPLEGYDYIIGSVHALDAESGFTVDESVEKSREAIRERFGGDPYAYTKAYYAALAQWAGRKEAAILGHFDLVAKFNEDGAMFDEESPAYLRPAMEAASALLEAGKIFEINTGAISRGYRRKPYPHKRLLRFLCERGARITFGSDAHAAAHVACGFFEAVELARACGFTSAVGWKEECGFSEYPL